MSLSAFDNKARRPMAGDLAKVLGRSSGHWKSLIKHIQWEYAPVKEAWSFSGTKWGWALRLARRRRNILYMTPCQRHFLVGVVLGEKAVEAARKSDIPEELLEAIEEAPRYPEGRGIRVEVRTKKDLENIKRLAAIKMGK